MVFARLTELEFLPDNVEDGFRLVRDSIVPTIKEQGGFRGLVFLRDPQTGSASVLSLWDSEADMDATVTGNYPVQIAKVSTLLSGPPKRRIYEVAGFSL
jgi:heme-degrading monooxygenase HmoA